MNEYRIALAGNPNTGKSTLFNALTGLRQHTGNWTGKTVAKAEGIFTFNGAQYRVIDLPGTYSLFSNSSDEEVARDYIIFGKPDVTVVVLDATALERNMNLALQVLEMTDKALICVNLADEAQKNGIEVNNQKLAQQLGVPVSFISAREKKGLDFLLTQVESVARGTIRSTPYRVRYHASIEEQIEKVIPRIESIIGNAYPLRWLALRLLDGDVSLLHSLERNALQSSKASLGEVTTNAAYY